MNENIRRILFLRHFSNIMTVPLKNSELKISSNVENSNDDAVSSIHESASRDLRIERVIETMKWIQTEVNSNFCKSEAKQIKSVIAHPLLVSLIFVEGGKEMYREL